MFGIALLCLRPRAVPLDENSREDEGVLINPLKAKKQSLLIGNRRGSCHWLSNGLSVTGLL